MQMVWLAEKPLRRHVSAGVVKGADGRAYNSYFRTVLIRQGDAFEPTAAELAAFSDQMAPAGADVPAQSPPALSTLPG